MSRALELPPHMARKGRRDRTPVERSPQGATDSNPGRCAHCTAKRCSGCVRFGGNWTHDPWGCAQRPHRRPRRAFVQGPWRMLYLDLL